MSKQSSDLIFCLVGPSGSGKSSVCKELIKKNSNLFLSISTTTRKPRVGEVEGVDYFFVDKEEFQRRLEKGNFIEFAQYGENLYGTEIGNIKLATEKSKTLILDIEYQGVLKLKKYYLKNEHQVIAIFISAPSKELLVKRLRAREDTSEEEIQDRLRIATNEVRQLLDNNVADFLVINQDLLNTVNEVENIINSRENFELRKISAYSKAELDKVRL